MTKSRTIASKKSKGTGAKPLGAKATIKAAPTRGVNGGAPMKAGAKVQLATAAPAKVAPIKPGAAKPTAAKIASVKAASSIQAERERKAQEQHDAWVAKANTIAASLGVAPLNTSGVDFRIAYAKTLRRD